MRLSVTSVSSGRTCESFPASNMQLGEELFRKLLRCLLAIVASALCVSLAACGGTQADSSSSRTGVCPDSSHWYSPSENNASDQVPNQCKSCLDPANAEHKACGVDAFLRSQACSGPSCSDDQGSFVFYRSSSLKFALQHDLRYRDPVRFPRAGGESCRFLVWALDPVIGVEDAALRDRFNFWRQAYIASATQVQPSYATVALALAIQPATTRGQHQFHIHIGTLTDTYRQAIDGLVRDPTLTQGISLNGYDFVAKYVPNAPGGGPFSGLSPFEVARQMIPGGESAMPVYGIVAAIALGGDGVFVLAAKGFDRAELNFRQAYDCDFAP